MNSLDIVPHAWNESMLKEIHTLYASYDSIGSPCVIKRLAFCAEEKAFGHYYTSLYGSDDVFDGTYTPIPNSVIAKGCNDTTTMNSFRALQKKVYCPIDTTIACISKQSAYASTTRFLMTAADQHIDAYINHYDINVVCDILRAQLDNNASKEFLKKLMAELEADMGQKCGS